MVGKKVAMEFTWTPFSLDHISMLFEDSIDHSSQFVLYRRVSSRGCVGHLAPSIASSTEICRIVDRLWFTKSVSAHE